MEPIYDILENVGILTFTNLAVSVQFKYTQAKVGIDRFVYNFRLLIGTGTERSAIQSSAVCWAPIP